MKRVLLAVHSASHEIYQNNIKALIVGYEKVIKKHNLFVDVTTFCGTYDDPDHNYIEWSRSYSHEKEVADVLFDVMGRVVNLTNYDVIIKTNTNTVVNLPLIWEFCNSIHFNPNLMYTNVCYHIGDGYNMPFPSGMFIMGSHDVWKKVCDSKNDTLQWVEKHGVSESVYHTKEYADGKLVWTGYSDEFLIGACLRRCGISIATLMGMTMSMTKREFFSGIIGHTLFDDVDTKYSCINCKMDIGNNLADLALGSEQEMFRIQYENYMISMICKLYELYNPSFQDVEWLYSRIRYCS